MADGVNMVCHHARRARADKRCQHKPVTVEEAAEMVGISRTSAYESLRVHGAILGVKALKVGRRTLVPRAALLRALGEGDTENVA